MIINQYDYLSGTISIDADAPQDWKNVDELPFWKDPNNDDWGVKLCRVLYHETIHFWQFLSSGYIANLVAEEWSRLIHYEDTGDLLSPGEILKAHFLTLETDPFSPSELAECWARHWDVHTREPGKIIREESIHFEDPARLQFQFGNQMCYTGDAFDTVMQVGEDCSVYGRPYRWLLEKLSGHSAFAALIFPILAHGAFSAPNPVKIFCDCVEEALKSEEVHKIVNMRTGFINYDWLISYRTVVANTLVPIFQQTGRQLHLSGFDVIKNTVLRSHPIFSEYPSKFMIEGYLKLHYPLPYPDAPPEFAKEYADAILEYAKITPIILLGLPGQPFYRLALGELIPPPSIAFRNMTWYGRRPVQLFLRAVQTREKIDQTYKEMSERLIKRVSRFNAAKKAVELGLAPNAFEV